MKKLTARKKDKMWIKDWTFFELAHAQLLLEKKPKYSLYDLMTRAYKILNHYNLCVGKNPSATKKWNTKTMEGKINLMLDTHACQESFQLSRGLRIKKVNAKKQNKMFNNDDYIYDFLMQYITFKTFKNKGVENE